MTRIGRAFKIGAAVVVVCVPATSAAQQARLGTIVLAAGDQTAVGRLVNEASATEKADPSSRVATPSRPTTFPAFVPRVRHGAPASRVGGATRARGTAVTIQTLVPELDEAALTLAAQPNFYWHLSAGTEHPVNFTLVDPDAIEPIVDAMIAGPFETGFHSVSLADYEARLEPGRRYEWFVAVVPRLGSRSADTVARGVVLRVSDPELALRVAEADPEAAAGLWAQSGIWYEALESLSERIGQSPKDPELHLQRSAMLEQVGLVLSAGR